jgi:peptide/nickel transport system substrate-binding protein
MSSRVSRRLKRLTAVASAAALVVGLAACGGTPAEPEAVDTSPRVLRIGSSAALSSLDPARSATPGVAYLTLVYEALVLRDPEGLLQPGLATEWDLSDDATELELTLREGVTFHDGAPFDAAAVKANLDAAPDRAGQIASQLSILTSVDVIDDYTVKLTMSRPASDILSVLASEAGMMISPEALGNEDLGTVPVGTGPFTVDEQNQTGIFYDAWDGYWNADRIKLDRIEILTGMDDDQVRLNALLTGEIDMTSGRWTQTEELEARAEPGSIVVETGPQATVVGIMLNTAQGQWANPAMRLAAMHAINRDGIVNALYGGVEGCEPVAQPFPTNFWANDNSLEDSDEAQYDPELAKEILEEAGLVGTPVKLYVGAATLYQNMAAAVQEQLNAIGLVVTVESYDTATLSDLRASGNFEASIALVNSGRPDPSQFVKQFYTPDGVFNPGHQAFEGIDEPLAAMNETVDQEERAGYMHEIMAAVLEQGSTVIPLCSPTTVWMYTSEIDGVNLAVNWDYDWSYIYYTKDK